MSGKTKKAVDLFNHFIAEYRKIGDFQLHPVKTRIALLTKMRFCAVNKIGEDFIDVHLVLTEPFHDNLCFHKIDNFSNRFFVHHLKICDKKDINAEVRKYMTLAYKVGNREHVKTK